MPGSIGPLELIVVLAIALIVLGPKKLPEVGRSIGKGMREFKNSISGDSDDREQLTAAVAEPEHRTTPEHQSAPAPQPSVPAQH